MLPCWGPLTSAALSRQNAMPIRLLHCSLHSELVLLFLSVLGIEHEMAHTLSSWSPASGTTLTGCGDLEGGVPTGEARSSIFLQRKSLVPSLSLSLSLCFRFQHFPHPQCSHQDTACICFPLRGFSYNWMNNARELFFANFQCCVCGLKILLVHI